MSEAAEQQRRAAAQAEQKRRQQILAARQREETQRAPAAPRMSDAEAAQIVAEGQRGPTREEMIAVAMLGKTVQNDVFGIKKASLGDLNVTPVDMSMVMPSGIARAIGSANAQPIYPAPGAPTAPAAPGGPFMEVPQHPVSDLIMPGTPADPFTAPPVPPPFIPQVQPAPVPSDGQQELNFDRVAKYEDIMQAVENLEDKVILLTSQVKELTTLLIDKKKPKLKTQDNGTQTG